MIPEEPILITYRTQKVIPRDGLLGAFARLAHQKPVLVGFVCGLVAVSFALLRSPGVIERAPAEAMLIALAVVTVWVVLFRAMTAFWGSLSFAEIGVVRAIAYDGTTFRTYEGEATVREITDPTLELVSSAPVPPEVLSGTRSAQQPWKVWILVQGDDVRYAIETRLMASDAATLRVDELGSDEHLPTPLVSPLLEVVRHQV